MTPSLEVSAVSLAFAFFNVSAASSLNSTQSMPGSLLCNCCTLKGIQIEFQLLNLMGDINSDIFSLELASSRSFFSFYLAFTSVFSCFTPSLNLLSLLAVMITIFHVLKEAFHSSHGLFTSSLNQLGLFPLHYNLFKDLAPNYILESLHLGERDNYLFLRIGFQLL